MSTLRKAAILRLATAAYEMELDVMTGKLEQQSNGRWLIGDHDLLTWLQAHQHEEVTLVLSSLDDERPAPVRTCRTCGRDYTDAECPHCRANRIRLRGHS